MDRFGRTSLVVLLGIASSLLTAALNLSLGRAMGSWFFTTMHFGFIPGGAVVSGFVAASGYYAGCRLFHVRPGAFLALQMALVAGGCFFLIYWLQYWTFILDDGRRAANVLDFPAFFKLALTTARYGRGAGAVNAAEVGEKGYLIGLSQFAGFLVGGLCVLAELRRHPVCAHCGRYLSRVGTSEQIHANVEAGADRARLLVTSPRNESVLEEACRPVAGTAEPGSGRLTLVLLECRVCQEQVLELSLHELVGRDWRSIGSQRVSPSKDVDLRPAFGRTPRAARRGLLR